MKLSAKSEYACLAMLQLAADSEATGPTTLKCLATKQQIPEGFLVQILQELKRAGLVISTRGSSGGYRLANPPEETTLADVLLATGGDEAIMSNLTDPTPAAEVLASLCADLRQQQLERLESLTLADLAAQTSPIEPMWYI